LLRLPLLIGVGGNLSSLSSTGS